MKPRSRKRSAPTSSTEPIYVCFPPLVSVPADSAERIRAEENAASRKVYAALASFAPAIHATPDEVALNARFAIQAIKECTERIIAAHAREYAAVHGPGILTATLRGDLAAHVRQNADAAWSQWKIALIPVTLHSEQIATKFLPQFSELEARADKAISEALSFGFSAVPVAPPEADLPKGSVASKAGADRIRAFMSSHRLSAERLSDKVRLAGNPITGRTIQTLLQRERARLSTWEAIAKAMDVSVKCLLAEGDRRPE